MSISLEGCSDLLTTKEIQELTKLNTQSIRRMLASGQLPGLKIGTRWFVPRSEFERFLSNKLEVNHEQ